MSPLKVRKVLNTIRGRDYEECLMKLEFMRYRACEPILKTLISAAANAKHNYGMNKAKLYVSECYANEGAFLQRAEPRALGQAFRYRKKQTHITIRVRERSD
jgi:large subunit ribosomal protein L22